MADIASAVEVCEERVLLTVTPVITQSQAQTDVTAAQIAHTSAVNTYTTTSQSILSGYDSAMQGHGSDFTNNTATLAGNFDINLQSIQSIHATNVQTFEAGFQATVGGFESTLTGDYATADGIYATATATHAGTFTSTQTSIEAGLDTLIASADGILNAAMTAASNLFNGTETTASGQFDTDTATADGIHSAAVAVHETWLQAQEAAAYATYDGVAGDNPTGALGIYNATAASEAATRDAFLSSYPDTTYDPWSVSSIDFDALWNTALSTVQSSLTAAETLYEGSINAAISAYDSAMTSAESTYTSLMTIADQNRDAAYSAADGIYNTNTSNDWNDYNNAVYGPGGIEETWQNSIDLAESIYSTNVGLAMNAYDQAVQAAQAILDSAIAAANQEYDDWLNGSLPGQAISSSFQRLQIIDNSTTPPTITWKTIGSVGWNPTESTTFASEYFKEPPVPDGYTLISISTSTAGSITTITEDYAVPTSGIGTGNSGSTTLTPACNNPWELAKVARTEFYIAELDGYYDQYLVDMNNAWTAYNGSVTAANDGYNITLYGNATGAAPYATGTPAEIFDSAMDAAYSSFSSDEQSVHATYDANMNAYYMAEMQYWEDMMNGLPATPPNPDDPAQFAKDYFVDVTALDINFAVAAGSAWTGWVSAERAADTTRDNGLINAEYQLGVDLLNASQKLATSQVSAEDAFAGDVIDIDADYAIAITGKQADIVGGLADDEQTFEQTGHAAAEIAVKAINLEERDREHRYADAHEIRDEAIALEEEDLANDLAGEEETRQNAYAAGDAVWLLAEAGAQIASTTIAAAGTGALINGVAAAENVFITAAVPLITSATQTFNNLVHADYVSAHSGDADQAAVSGEWTRYFNVLATAAQNALISESGAAQVYANSMAGFIQTTMNNIASEATALATAYGNALTNYVSLVTAAATLEVSQSAAAAVTWVDTVATGAKNAARNLANAWLQMADDDAEAATVLADDYSAHWNTFFHDYLGALVPHVTNLINADRQAAQDGNTELTVLAQGVLTEEVDLTNDELTEWKAAALALSPLDDIVVNSWANQEARLATLNAWNYHTDMQTAPLSDFAYAYPGGASPMSGMLYTVGTSGTDGSDESLMTTAFMGANGLYPVSSPSRLTLMLPQGFAFSASPQPSNPYLFPDNTPEMSAAPNFDWNQTELDRFRIRSRAAGVSELSIFLQERFIPGAINPNPRNWDNAWLSVAGFGISPDIIRPPSVITINPAVSINVNKQAGHITGMPEYINRVKQGKTTSAFFGAESGAFWTLKAWNEGIPTRDPSIKILYSDISVGTGPNGGMQNQVRVVMDRNGLIHGTPWGPEY